MTNLLNKMIGDKKRYRQYLHDIAALPKPYADTLTALDKYIWNFAANGNIMDALEGILHMFQESAAEGVPVGQVIGDDPVEFADNILAQYPDDLWMTKIEKKLRTQVQEAQNAGN
jgi:DNA-binding ferritin-like protein (Dps family)